MKPPKKKKTGRGKKECPRCRTVVGARLHLCKCGHDFLFNQPGKKTTKPPKSSTKPKTNMRGKKLCPKCNGVCGARTCECNCGYVFSIRKHPKQEKKPPQTYDKVKQGRKACRYDDCDAIMGSRCKVCPGCNREVKKDTTTELRAKKTQTAQQKKREKMEAKRENEKKTPKYQEARQMADSLGIAEFYTPVYALAGKHKLPTSHSKKAIAEWAEETAYRLLGKRQYVSPSAMRLLLAQKYERHTEDFAKAVRSLSSWLNSLAA